MRGLLVAWTMSIGVPVMADAQFATLPSGFSGPRTPGIRFAVGAGGTIRPRATVPVIAATTDIGLSWASVGIGVATRPYNLYGVEDRTARQYMTRAAVTVPSLGVRGIDVVVFSGVGRAASEVAYPSDVVSQVEWTVPIGVAVSLTVLPIRRRAPERLWIAPSYTMRRIEQEAGVEVDAVRLRRRSIGVSGGMEVELGRGFGMHTTFEWSRILAQEGRPNLVTVGVGLHYGVAFGR